jgi:hypothetical protein
MRARIVAQARSRRPTTISTPRLQHASACDWSVVEAQRDQVGTRLLEPVAETSPSSTDGDERLREMRHGGIGCDARRDHDRHDERYKQSPSVSVHPMTRSAATAAGAVRTESIQECSPRSHFAPDGNKRSPTASAGLVWSSLIRFTHAGFRTLYADGKLFKSSTTTASMRRSAACDSLISDRSTLAELRHTTSSSSGATISTTSVFSSLYCSGGVVYGP